jgi:hypothetical protein
MKYQAVILNFDQRSVKYVAAQNLRPTKKAAIAASGSTPPAPKRRRK